MRRLLTAMLTTILLAARAVCAAEASAPHEAGGAEPSIFAGSLVTALLTLAVFVVLLAILGRWAWKPILGALQKREEHIRQIIEQAEQAQRDAEKTLAEYRQQLGQVQKEAAALLEKGRAEAVHLAEELTQKAKDEAARLRSQAQRDVAAARDQAVRELYQQSCRLALDLTTKLLPRTLSAEDQTRLLEEALHEIENQPARRK